MAISMQASDEKPIVIICDDHVAIRAGVARILEDSGIMVVGECATIQGLLDLAGQFPNAIVFTDLAIENLPFPDLMKRIRAVSPSAKVIVYSAREGQATINLVYQSGAASFVPKRAAPEEIVTAVKLANKNERYLPAQVATDLAKLHLDGNAPQNLLNARELEIFVSYVREEPVESIAARLDVSDRTIHNTLSHISRKIAAPRTSFFQVARRYGLID